MRLSNKVNLRRQKQAYYLERHFSIKRPGVVSPRLVLPQQTLNGTLKRKPSWSGLVFVLALLTVKFVREFALGSLAQRRKHQIGGYLVVPLSQQFRRVVRAVRLVQYPLLPVLDLGLVLPHHLGQW